MKFGNKRTAWLYAVVFKSRLSMLVVFLLYASFFVQPVSQAYAQESEETAETEVAPAESVNLDEELDTETTISEEIENAESEVEVFDEVFDDDNEITTDADELLSDAVTETEQDLVEELFISSSTENDESIEVVTETSFSTTTEINSDSFTSSSTSEPTASSEVVSVATTTAADVNQASTTEVVTKNSTSTSENTDVVNIDQDTNGNDDTTGTDEQNESFSVESEEIDPSTINSSPASTTEVSSNNPESSTELAYIVTDENYYQFSKQSCVPMGNGAFHCSTQNTLPPDSQTVVYSQLGSAGNQEIFIRTRQGKEEQITDNQYEDTSPEYDPVSQQIVWQRSIDGRFQIMLYDIVAKKESQLTFSRTNNMEPAVSQSGIVWQAWDGFDWEIMYYDGSFTDQLTDNLSQDVGPTIEDEYILWSVPGDNNQEARVYSLESKETLSVTGHEGGSIANPRFVLVYDTQFDNGDIVTQSFDPETGLATPIAAKPAPEPIDIPQPDPIGEIRALINTKTNEQDDIVKKSTTTTSTGTSTPVEIENDALVLSETETESESLSTTTDSVDEEFVLDEFDLVITPEGVSTSSATSTQGEAG